MQNIDHIERSSAIRWVAQHELTHMSEDERYSGLLVVWRGEDSFIFYMLTEELKEELRNLEDFTEIPNPKWNPLILEYIITYKLQAVSNRYLKKRLIEMGHSDDFVIDGETPSDLIHKCECCSYLVPSYLCPVCGWEDSKGSTSPDFGVKNKNIRLSAAKENFLSTSNYAGDAEVESLLSQRLPDRLERFDKAES